MSTVTEYRADATVITVTDEYGSTVTTKFARHGVNYTVTENSEGSFGVTVARDGEELERVFFSFEDAPGAHACATAFVAGWIAATDPEAPSLEERLAPWGLEWELEQEERRGWN